MLLEGCLHDITTYPEAQLKSHATTLQGSTLLLYLKAASIWLYTELGVNVPIVNPTTQKIVQPFHNSIAQALKWGMPKLK